MTSALRAEMGRMAMEIVALKVRVHVLEAELRARAKEEPTDPA